eukprot:2276138-Rhodomonas_salina.2
MAGSDGENGGGQVPQGVHWRADADLLCEAAHRDDGRRTDLAQARGARAHRSPPPPPPPHTPLPPTHTQLPPVPALLPTPLRHVL